MNLKDALHNGMRVVGPDDRDYGPIDRYDDEAVYVQGRAIPFGAIERLDQDRLYIGKAGQSSLLAAGANRNDLGGEVRVPLLEEKVEIGTRQIDLGEIRIHKHVDESEEVHRGPLNREDVEIERIRVDRPVAVPEERRQEGDWLIVPIMEEVFVVQKQLMVTEEIRIRKRMVTVQHEVRETVRRERATIEDTRSALPRSMDDATSDRADGAPGRRGMRRADVDADPRETSRTEELSTRGATSRRDDDAAWDRLHEEVRDAGR